MEARVREDEQIVTAYVMLVSNSTSGFHNTKCPGAPYASLHLIQGISTSFDDH